MMERRVFLKQFLAAGAALAISGTGVAPRKAEARKGSIKGVCLYVPSLKKADEFVEFMDKNAAGSWEFHPLEGSITERYFTARQLYEEARGKANTFVGVVDPGTFAIVHEAIVDNSGSFHYITYEDRNRVIFSAQL